MKRFLLFDVDGTLVDVAGAGRAALRGAFPFGPREVWVIGDTPAEIRCGRHSGLRSLAA